MYSEISEEQDRLERLFTHAVALNDNDEIDPEVTSGYLSFLCVRVYVYVEKSVHLILRRYVKSATDDGPIAKFMDQQLRRPSRNLRQSELLGLVGRFSEDWKNHLRDEMQLRLGDSLDSIVNNRNKIAHGDDADISLVKLKGYVTDSIAIVNHVYRICSPISDIHRDT